MAGSTVAITTVDPATGDNLATLATTTTDSNGAYTFTLAPLPTGPVRITASGGSYTSEEDGATITPGQITALLESVSSGPATVEVNPLTSLIDERAICDLGQNQTPLGTALSNATSKVENIYGLGSDPKSLIPDFSAAGLGTDAGKLGLVVGAIINEDQVLCPASPGSLVTALTSDFCDGVFDGKSLTRNVSYCNQTMPAIAGTSDFMDALSGVNQSQLVTRAFAFGGTGNSLTSNGVAPDQVMNSGELAAIENGVVGAAPSPANSFTAGPSMSLPVTPPQDRSGATATLLQDGRVLVAGGFSGDSGFQATSQIYDPSGNSFSAGPSMILPRENATATRLTNGNVLIPGGTGTPGVTATSEIYDVTSNSFTSGPLMQTARENAVAVLLPGGKVLVAGGDNSGGALNGAELYDPVGGTFTAIASTMSAQRAIAMAALLPNGKVLIAGGSDRGSSILSADVYDPVANTFSAVTNDMNHSRDQGTATTLPNGKVLIAGGVLQGDGSITLSSTELYDPVTNSFQSPRTVSMTTARQNHTATLLPSGQVLIAGGTNSNGGNPLVSTELYDPSTDSFGSVVNMTMARKLMTGTLLNNGNVIIIGGFSSSTGTTNTSDLYEPSSGPPP